MFVEHRSKENHGKKMRHGRQDCKYFYDFTLFQMEFCGIRTELKSRSMKVLKLYIFSVLLAFNYTLKRNTKKFWWKNKMDLGVGILSYKGAIYIYIYIYIYTGCNRRNVPYFGRVFLMLNYIEKTQNTYIQSWTVTEIKAREKCGELRVSTHCTCQLTV
jgi:hypothetical protein